MMNKIRMRRRVAMWNTNACKLHNAHARCSMVGSLTVHGKEDGNQISDGDYLISSSLLFNIIIIIMVHHHHNFRDFHNFQDETDTEQFITFTFQNWLQFEICFRCLQLSPNLLPILVGQKKLRILPWKWTKLTQFTHVFNAISPSKQRKL